MANANVGPSTGSFRATIPSKEHPAAADRYHLYVGLFCPFAHRVLITRHLKGLDKFLPLSVVKPYPKEDGGWRFPSSADEYPGATVDHLFNSKFLHEVYFRSAKDYSGKYSVPLLWDTQSNVAVNNESEDVMRFLNHGFDELLDDNALKSIDLYPSDLRSQIDEINAWLVPELNTGVYKAGFAQDQASYDSAVVAVFKALDKLSDTLAAHGKPYILGDRMTELDIKAYATLVRFDAIYVQHFKCNLRMIRQYPTLNRYLKNLHWKEGWKVTTDFKHIKENYSKSHSDVNPKAITPMGPDPNVEPWTDEDEKWRKGWEQGGGEEVDEVTKENQRAMEKGGGTSIIGGL
jgi:putative glutathione S-transferase